MPDYGKDTNPALPRGKEADSGWAKLFPAKSYLNLFFAEKKIPNKIFDLMDKNGMSHSVPNGVVVEAIAQTSGGERKKIEDTLRKIDFHNGDVNHFFEHLAKGLVAQYSGNLHFASSDGGFVAALDKEALPTILKDLDKSIRSLENAPEFSDLLKELTRLKALAQRAAGHMNLEKEFFKAVSKLEGETQKLYNKGNVKVEPFDPRLWTPYGFSIQFALEHIMGYTIDGEGEQYSHLASISHEAFNKFNPEDLLLALVEILEKYELVDAVETVKKITPTIQKAWRNRE